jgi:hypothetical protein
LCSLVWDGCSFCWYRWNCWSLLFKFLTSGVRRATCLIKTHVVYDIVELFNTHWTR